MPISGRPQVGPLHRRVRRHSRGVGAGAIGRRTCVGIPCSIRPDVVGRSQGRARFVCALHASVVVQDQVAWSSSSSSSSGVTRVGTYSPSRVLIDAPNVAELVRVGEMPAVPRDKEIAAVNGSNGQVERVTCRICWHDVARNVGVDDIQDLRRDLQELQPIDEPQAVVSARIVTALQFIDDRRAGDKVVALRCGRPPLPCPLAARHHLGPSTLFVEEARNAGLDVDGLAHGEPSLAPDRREAQRPLRGHRGSPWSAEP